MSGNSQEPTVRSALEEDVDGVHEILMSPHVIAGSMRVPFSGLHVTRDRLAPKAGAYQLIADVDGHVVGFAELQRLGFGSGDWMDAQMMGLLREPVAPG